MPTFTSEQLYATANRLLQAMGATPDEADIVADHLVASNLAGHDSHGVVRIPQYFSHAREGVLAMGQPIVRERESPSTALLDGNNGWGQVVAREVARLAIAKANATGLAVVGARRTYHIGRAGAYAHEVASAGYAVTLWCNVHGVARVAPWGGTQARLATNPIAVAIPSRRGPLVLDMTTTVVAEGKVRIAKNKGLTIPEGWVIDRDGRPTTNPADLYQGGTLLPFGGDCGYKGFGLGLMADAMAGAITGAGCGAMPGTRHGNGMLLQAVDPAMFDDREAFLDRIDAYVDYVRGSATRPGVDAILLPGDPELAMTAKRRQEGVPLDNETWRQLCEVAEKLGVRSEIDP